MLIRFLKSESLYESEVKLVAFHQRYLDNGSPFKQIPTVELNYKYNVESAFDDQPSVSIKQRIVRSSSKKTSLQIDKLSCIGHVCFSNYSQPMSCFQSRLACNILAMIIRLFSVYDFIIMT